METRNEKILFGVLVGACLLLSAFRITAPNTFSEYCRVVPQREMVEINGTYWQQLVKWDFSQGPFPDGWGWGEFGLRDDLLEMTDNNGDFTVYFTPIEHGGDFILETEFRLHPGPTSAPAEVHLITRDSNQLNSECGLALFGDTADGFLRNTVRGTDYLKNFVHTGRKITYDDWHTMRLTYDGGRLSAEVNGKLVLDVQKTCPTTMYGEPHLAVRNGSAEFRNIAVLSRNFSAPLPGRHAMSDLIAGATVKSARPAGIQHAGTEPADKPTTIQAGMLGEFLGTFTSPSLYMIQAPRLPQRASLFVKVFKIIFYLIIAMVAIYVLRHFIFTINRLTGAQRHPYLDIDTADWPSVTVLIPAHNEEDVIAEILTAVLDVEYPKDKLHIIPVNDRSTDTTGEIIESFVKRYPDRLKPFHREDGKPGKAAALRDAMDLVEDEFVLVFDADYIPGRGLIKQLMAPFFDPEVGAVMGRVVPNNVGQNLLTRMLDLERSGGYQVDQQARMNLHLVPQYGGTVGGIRVKALESVGGWRTDSLAEDTDATYRLLLGGWKTVYQNRSECYEQVPDTWRSRMRQIFRWTLGHNQTLFRYFWKLQRNRRTGFREKLDGTLLLGIYWMSPVMLLGWLVGSTLWYLGVNKPGLIIILAVTCYSTVGNFAVFFEIATAAHLDGTRGRIKLLPFVLLGFLVSLVSVTRATFTHLFGMHGRDGVFWHKTKHHKRREEWV